MNYSIFLYGETSSAFDFAEAINAIENADEHDQITIYLSGGGGCVSSTDAFLHAIHMAQERGVRVHCVASGLVASAHIHHLGLFQLRMRQVHISVSQR